MVDDLFDKVKTELIDFIRELHHSIFLKKKRKKKLQIRLIMESLSKAKCNLIQQNYYLFDYYDEVLKDIERVTDIDFGKRIRTLGEIKKVLAKTQK